MTIEWFREDNVRHIKCRARLASDGKGSHHFHLELEDRLENIMPAETHISIGIDRDHDELVVKPNPLGNYKVKTKTGKVIFSGPLKKISNGRTLENLSELISWFEVEARVDLEDIRISLVQFKWMSQ
jgi:hypothetical protein